MKRIVRCSDFLGIICFLAINLFLTSCLEIDFSKLDLSKFDKELMESTIVKPGIYKTQNSEGKSVDYYLVSSGNRFRELRKVEELRFTPLAKTDKGEYLGVVGTDTIGSDTTGFLSALKTGKDSSAFFIFGQGSLETSSAYFQTKHGITISGDQITGNITPDSLVDLIIDTEFRKKAEIQQMNFDNVCIYEPLDSKQLKEVDQYSIQVLENIKYNKTLPAQTIKKLEFYSNMCNEQAAFALGKIYYNGSAVSKSIDKALEYFLISFAYGNKNAAFNIGVIYHSKNDPEKSLEFYKIGVESGDSMAQNNLGTMYQNGQGVAQDYAEAVKWYRKAAEQGDANAQNNLGTMYQNGQGVTQDYAEAVKWYRKAVEQGNANAQYNLGVLYSNGWGVAQDDVEAVKWYRKAAEQGDANAKKILEELTNNEIGNWKLNPIISGKWFEPSEQDKRRILVKISSDLQENNKTKGVPSLNDFRALKLPFYPGTTLYEGQFLDTRGNFMGLFAFIEHKNGVYLINGRSDVLHNLNKSAPLVLNNSNDVEMYLKFFCAAIMGEEGNFLIVEDVSDIPWLSTATKEDKEITAGGITPLRISKNSDGTWAASGTVIYSDVLFSTDFEITSDGKVEMADDKPLVKDIPLKKIIFDGPVRKEIN